MNTCHCEDRSQMEKTYCVVRVQATLHCAPVLAVEWWRAWVAKARQQMRHSTLLRWAASLQPATLLFPDLSDRRGSISGRSEMEPFDLPSLMAVMVLVCGQAHSVP